MTRRFHPLLVAALAVLALAAGCGPGNESVTADRVLPRGSTVPTVPTTTLPTGPKVCVPETPVVPPEGKPEVKVPEGPAPTTLVSTDVKVGDGAEAKNGDSLKLQYVGVSKTTGQEFDASWGRNAEPIDIVLGSGGVIKGWDQGIVGMKVGGRRQLVIPPDLGYGATGQGEKIPANDTLVFVVDLVQICATVPVPETTPTGSVPGSIPETAPGSVPGSVPVG